MASIPKGAAPEWKTNSNNPGHTLTNPGHSFVEALKRNNRLYSRVQKYPNVMKWIQAVERPNQHFIEMRYSCHAPDAKSYKEWWETYTRLLAWLRLQATQL
ncbi:hypothetical protein [Synechococcus sp. PCC 7336]|uniref:hypothetical protein n=1 Tax=Synechococcus sp. PCC 7336 TaxID=195250 RepID=UPI001930B2D0|nr:hypothetical protein [Synechococcus sp. PCC 7336]